MASPTLSRLGKVLTLQWASFKHAELQCADAMSAFLQGERKKMQETEDVCARALHEIACALNISLGYAVKLSNAVHGLGNAPRRWWLLVDRFSTSLGGRRTRTDPAVWWFFSEGLGTKYLLVAACVDDFIITGNAGKSFEELKLGLRWRFRWCSWKLQSFGLCGVRVHKNVDHIIVLDQTSFLKSGTSSIHVDTHRDLDRSLTSAEITNLRGVWGAIQWKVTQTGPQHAAALSELQSKISQPTLNLIKETNKLVSDVKLNKTHMTIHPFSRQLKSNDLALIGYTDAAQSDRIDGSATGG